MRATLRDDVTAFLLEHGPSTSPAIAMGIRARRDDVDAVLAGGGFCPADRPEGASPRAKFFDLSQRVPRAPGGKSRAALMLAVLSDGREHSRDEIFRKTGRFFLTNNAAAELRRMDYDVRHGRRGMVDVYWLNGRAAQPLEASAGATLSGEVRSAA